MNEELEELRKIGVEKIHEQTHIPLQNVQALLDGSYESFTRVHFLGFVSILEREYKLELTEMKKAGVAHFTSGNESEENGVFVVTKEAPKKTYLLIIALILFTVGIAYQIFVVNKEESVKIVDNIKIEKVKQSIAPLVESETKSPPIVENNITEKVVVTPEKKEKLEVVVPPKEKIVKKQASLVIQSKSKVWLGYIDVATNQKYQRVFHGTKKLDPAKSWLFIFGHGDISIVINGKVHKFNSSKTVRFLYKDSTVKKIDAKEFKKLNKGHKW